MRIAQRLLLSMLLVLATLAVSGSGHAQEPSGATASGSVTVRGNYSATVTAAPGNTLPPTGTYQAVFGFSSTAAITSFDLATQSGGFSSSGSYTAQVTASGVPDFDVTGTYQVTGTFVGGRYTVTGSALISTPDSGSVTFSGTGGSTPAPSRSQRTAPTTAK